MATVGNSDRPYPCTPWQLGNSALSSSITATGTGSAPEMIHRRSLQQAGFMFEDIGRDPENKVIILTGSGDSFIDNEEFGTGQPDSSVPATVWANVVAFAK